MKLPDSFEREVSKRILTIDIETRPSTAYIWDAKTEWVNPGMVIDHGSIICWAAKWYGTKRVMFASDHHDGHDAMIEGAWELLNEADIVVTFNGDKFDHRHIRREFILAGLPPVTPFKSVDLIKTVRAKFAWHSNSLNHVAGRLAVGEKVRHAGFDLWRGCMAGDEKSWATMKRYNIGDVRLTEDLYVELLPWIHTHPAVAVSASGELRCNRCGSTDLDRAGDVTAVVHTYALYRCQNCKGMVRAQHLRRISGVTGVQ